MRSVCDPYIHPAYAVQPDDPGDSGAIWADGDAALENVKRVEPDDDDQRDAEQPGHDAFHESLFGLCSGG